MPPRSTRRFLRWAPLAAALTVFAAPALAGDARVLDDDGWLLSVGNWRLATIDGGGRFKVPDTRVLGYELRDLQGRVWFEGTVPGTEADGVDATPVLSRNPVTGEILLAWSRQSGEGARELVALRWDNQTWARREISPGTWVADVQVLASGTANQADPDLLHDSSGHAYLAWREMDWLRPVRFLVLSPEGEVISESTLTDATGARAAGPPRLGVDAFGGVFAAFFALGADETPELHVHEAAARGGGVIHVPDPIIELGRTATVSTEGLEAIEPASDPSSFAPPRLDVAVLGGTPVLYWVERDADGREVLHHVERDASLEWLGADFGSIPLSSGSGVDVEEALGLLEARFRSVLSLVQRPIRSPSPVRSPGLVLDRR